MTYDVVIVGAGPGGYVCAIRSAQLGLRTALVEEHRLGGVCLNWGCIPTKALYAATKLLSQTETAPEMGIAFDEPEIDLPKLAQWKDSVVKELTDGIGTLLERGGVEIYRARGVLAGSGKVRCSTGEVLEADAIVLATGSSPVEIPGFAFAPNAVWTSTDALALHEVPERLAVIGGGVIGLELATIYRRLGSAVTVIELLPEILATLDLDRRTIALLKRSLASQGISIATGTKAVSYSKRDGSLRLELDGREPLDADRILVAVGRRPNTSDLGLETVGIKVGKGGFLEVSDGWRVGEEGLYAIGDVIGGPMLAHKASTEAVALAEQLAGQEVTPPDFAGIPQAIFTDPEIASVGLSEKAAKEAGQRVKIGRFPYAVLGKALGMRERDGLFQIIGEEDSGRILGVQIIGADASDLISEAALAVRQALTLEQVVDTIHPHPTLPEGFHGAAENALGRAIHIANR